VTRTRLAALMCSVFAMATLAGCSSAGGQNTVFSVFAPSSDGGRATTVDVVDIGLPTLTNVTGSSVTLRSISLVSVSRAVRLRSVTAYGEDATHLGLGLGDLLRYCRRTDKPFPVTADVARPHAQSAWNVVLAITFARPGTYHLVRDKIVYITDGHTGWQYQQLDTTITVTAASKETRPRLDGC
jgi:hypothetical protein